MNLKYKITLQALGRTNITMICYDAINVKIFYIQRFRSQQGGTRDRGLLKMLMMAHDWYSKKMAGPNSEIAQNDPYLLDWHPGSEPCLVPIHKRLFRPISSLC